MMRAASVGGLVGWLGVLALWIGLAPGSAHAAVRTYAVVVGNNEPPGAPAGDGLHPLHYADDDAVRYAALLGQFSDELRLLTVLDATSRLRYPGLRVDDPPTLRALRGHIAWLSARIESDLAAGDRPVLYMVFSGHGAVGANGDAFLAMLDGRLSRSVLFNELLSAIPAAQIHLIIDACHAAGVVGLRGKRGFGRQLDAHATAVSDDDARSWAGARTLDRFPHVGVFVATTAGEQAHEWSAIEAGVFSHEVLSGLWGAADINADLQIEYSELQAFVASANRALSDPRAVPRVVARPPPSDPHAPLADLATFGQAVWLKGDARKLGHFHIELENGQRHLDAHLGLDGVTVGVPAAGRVYVRNGAGEAALSSGAPRTIALEQLAMGRGDAQARGSTASAFQRALFAEAFSVDYYRGHVDSVQGIPVSFRAPLQTPFAQTNASPLPPPVTALVPAPPPLIPVNSHDRPRRHGNPRMGAGVALAVIAGVAAPVALGLGGHALRLRSQFTATELEADAHAINAKHRRYTVAAITTGVVALAAGVTAAVLLSIENRRKKQSRRLR
jgi:hypothetical protein